jgi:hypothetical protein
MMTLPAFTASPVSARSKVDQALDGEGFKLLLEAETVFRFCKSSVQVDGTGPEAKNLRREGRRR